MMEVKSETVLVKNGVISKLEDILLDEEEYYLWYITWMDAGNPHGISFHVSHARSLAFIKNHQKLVDMKAHSSTPTSAPKLIGVSEWLHDWCHNFGDFWGDFNDPSEAKVYKGPTLN